MLLRLTSLDTLLLCVKTGFLQFCLHFLFAVGLWSRRGKTGYGVPWSLPFSGGPLRHSFGLDVWVVLQKDPFRSTISFYTWDKVPSYKKSKRRFWNYLTELSFSSVNDLSWIFLYSLLWQRHKNFIYKRTFSSQYPPHRHIIDELCRLPILL